MYVPFQVNKVFSIGMVLTMRVPGPCDEWHTYDQGCWSKSRRLGSVLRVEDENEKIVGSGNAAYDNVADLTWA